MRLAGENAVARNALRGSIPLPVEEQIDALVESSQTALDPDLPGTGEPVDRELLISNVALAAQNAAVSHALADTHAQ